MNRQPVSVDIVFWEEDGAGCWSLDTDDALTQHRRGRPFEVVRYQQKTVPHLSEFYLGRPVRERDTIADWAGRTPRWGHVTGFDTIELDSGTNTILRVKWSNGIEKSVDPASVDTF